MSVEAVDTTLGTFNNLKSDQLFETSNTRTKKLLKNMERPHV